MSGRLHLSILIPTCGRIDSLMQTLRHLSRSMTEDASVIVIDNSAEGEISEKDLMDTGVRGLQVLHEPVPGKGNALNRALSDAVLGNVIAILDDDMSPCENWASLVLATCEKYPDFDIFSGSSFVIWPPGESPPAWASDDFTRGIALSVVEFNSTRDLEMGSAGALEYPSGNHFWFRSRALNSIPRFPDIWASEAHFVASLRAAGHRGIFVSTVNCGHRVQPELLNETTVLARAKQFGIASARLDRVRFDASKGTLLTKKLRMMKLRVKRLIEIPRWAYLDLRATRHPTDKVRLRARSRWKLWQCAETVAHFGRLPKAR